MKQESTDTGARILWTGGWDSTFRVLYVALVDRRKVDPHYIIDTGRPSTLCELRAISRIRDLLRISDKEAYERVSNLQITPQNEIPKDAEITSSWRRLTQRLDVAWQYDLLARYAKCKNLTDLELGGRGGHTHSLLKENVERTPFGSYKFKRGVAGDDGGEVFARFEFPTFEYTKAQIKDIAKEQGFLKILEQS